MIQLSGPAPGTPAMQWPWKERQDTIQDLRVVLAPSKKAPVSAATATAKIARESTRKSAAKRSSRSAPRAKTPVSRSGPRDVAKAAPALPPSAPTPPAQPASPVASVPLPALAAEDLAPPPAQVVAQARLAPVPEVREALPQPRILARRDFNPETFAVPKPVDAEAAELAPIPQADAAALAAAARAARERAASQAREAEEQRLETVRQAQAAEARAQEQAALRKAEEAAREEAMRQAQEAAALQRAQELAARQRAEEAARDAALEAERQREAGLLAERQAAEAAALQAARQAAEDSAAARVGERERSAAQAQLAQSSTGRAPDPGQSGVPARVGDIERNAAGKPPSGRLDAPPVVKPGVRLPAAPPDNLCRRSAGQWSRPNLQVATYAAVWRQGIRENARFDLLQGAKSGSYDNPVVTVAVRSDGSVESVTFNRSSGHAQIDNAVRRIIQMLAPYEAFPRELEMDCDVIEIPSIWSFDRALRLTWRGQ